MVSLLTRMPHPDSQPGPQPRGLLLLEELADAALDGSRKAYVADLTAAPLLIIDDIAMRKLPSTAAEDLLEIIMGLHGRARSSA